ncbi:MAG: hypothetical protein IIC93_01110 [Chloroflexi bacterium]|nr:hypothetical protein [Chloroflexota bacterium]
MKLFSRRYLRLLAPLVAGGAALAVIACGSDTETIVVQTVIVEREVAGETVVETVIVEKQVAGETIIQTVIVEKEVTITIPGVAVVQTVIVEKEGERVVVVVTATATAIPTIAGIEPVSPPSPQSGANEVVIAVFDVGDENGWNQAQSSDGLKNLGLAETLYLRDPVTDSTVFWLGRDWTIASDLGSATVDIDTRAEFQWIDDSGVVRASATSPQRTSHGR